MTKEPDWFRNTHHNNGSKDPEFVYMGAFERKGDLLVIFRKKWPWSDVKYQKGTDGAPGAGCR
jgi:hypothetical protein